MDDVAISLINITHMRDALSKAQVINEAETPSHGLDHYFYYASTILVSHKFTHVSQEAVTQRESGVKPKRCRPCAALAQGRSVHRELAAIPRLPLTAMSQH